MKTHNLKTHPEYFQKVLDRKKKFELRKNDRDFKVGDCLCLEEWSPIDKEYTGREIYVIVDYIFDGGKMGLEEGMVIMSINDGK
jgi:ribosomal protein S17